MGSLIKLNGSNSTSLDLTRFIPVPEYNVNAVEAYEEWTDSAYTTHRRLLSSKAQGDFTLKFHSLSEYESFMTFFNANMDSDTGAINADVFLMYPYETRQGIDVFLTFAPQDDLPYLVEGKGSGFKVNVKQVNSGLVVVTT